MKDKTYKKVIFVFSVLSGIAFLSSIPAMILDVDWLYGVSVVFMSLFFAILGGILSTKIEVKDRMVRNFLLISLILILIIIPGAILNIFPLIAPPTILMLLLLGALLFQTDKKQTTKLVVFILLLITGFVFKKFRLPFAGVLIVLLLGILASGSFLLGMKTLLTLKGNLYLRILGTVCFLLITINSLCIMFKYQHWPGAALFMHMSLIPMIVATMFIMITLPNSGFINWKKEQRQILTRKILIPWAFLLLFMALRLLLPMHVQKKIFEKDPTTIEPFNMFPYKIEMKDGMKEDQ
ncbi:MAG: hypothetical protein KAT38_03275 [Bacteroidales bacterium]|nr:hypothetical protein [Bacteroidales bacterium]